MTSELDIMSMRRPRRTGLPEVRSKAHACAMRRLFYAGGSIVISDQVCKAVLRYARALARNDSANVVTLPSFTEDFGRGISHILVDPTSQLLSVPTADLEVELTDAQIVEILEGRTKSLDPERPDWSDDITDIEDLTVYYWGL